jgi:4-hydroxy-3-methylbut-2-enyl diphosphate reductase
LILAAPRGYCAGVDRAVQTVEHALDLSDGAAPVYVRKQIVHNLHVVAELEERGAVFVDSEHEVPEGATVVLSAHGVAPEVYRAAEARGLQVIDATCPLVTKVHNEAKRYAARGYTIVLIGHAGHEEVVGTMGEAPDAIRLVGSAEEVEALTGITPETPLAYVTQTDPLGRRDPDRDRRAPRPLPADRGPREGGHLLRDLQPPGGRQGPRAARPARAGGRLAELLQLGPSRRGGA